MYYLRARYYWPADGNHGELQQAAAAQGRGRVGELMSANSDISDAVRPLADLSREMIRRWEAGV